MKLASRIFRGKQSGKDFYITSKFGPRNAVYDSKGKLVSSAGNHNGCDYGTHGKGLAQYALEDGVVLSAGKDSSGAIFAWVRYPRLGIELLHYHLKSVSVKKGAAVNSDTIIGYTGTTGNSTGVHLHLALRHTGSTKYYDPEAYDYEEYVVPAPALPYEGVSDEELARRVWKGEFGNGEDRKKALGVRFSSVQALVNKGVGKDNPQPTPVPTPTPTGFKKGEKVVPTKLISYTGVRLVQWDKQYTVYQDSNKDRVVLAAPRNGKLVIWAAMNINNVRRV